MREGSPRQIRETFSFFFSWTASMFKNSKFWKFRSHPNDVRRFFYLRLKFLHNVWKCRFYFGSDKQTLLGKYLIFFLLNQFCGFGDCIIFQILDDRVILFFINHDECGFLTSFNCWNHRPHTGLVFYPSLCTFLYLVERNSLSDWFINDNCFDVPKVSLKR